MRHRAYSLLTLKAVDEEQRTIEGLATTMAPDRMGDIVEPRGATFGLPMPLLWQHDAKSPIGQVLTATVTETGIAITARIAKGVSSEIDRAWNLIQSGLVRGLSIGFRALDVEPVNAKDPWGPQRFKKWEWLELSAVTIAANADASIALIKSLDRPLLAASGRVAVSSIPGASGSGRQTSMTISEQLTTEKSNLAIKSTRLEELLTAADGTLEDDEQTERDGLVGEVKSLTAKVNHLSTLEDAQRAQAGTVPAASGGTLPMVPRRAAPHVEVSARPKGQLFARYAMAVAAGHGSYSDTLAYAKRFTDTPEVVAYIKAVEGTSVVSSPAWGGELVYPTNLVSEFVELLRAETLIGRIPGFRMTPFNVRVPRQTAGSTVNWVGEGASKPVGELSFDTISMPYHKIAGIVVLTEELVRLSSPSAEETVRRDLVEQIARFIDRQFIQVAISAGANNPASITNGVTSPSATGADLTSFLYDLSLALGTFDTAGVSTDGLVIVTTPALARGISMFTNPLGQTPTGFGVTPNGGTLLGYPVFVSASVDAGVFIIFKPSEILMADDGRVTLDASREATLDMDGGSPITPVFSLWQRNCVGIRAERWITWLKRRDTGTVAVIDTASYGPNLGSP